jgi:TonB family protein
LGNVPDLGKEGQSSMIQEKHVCTSDSQQVCAGQEFQPKPPEHQAANKFAQGILVEAPGYTERRLGHCAISLGIHCSVILLLLALPLFFSSELQMQAFLMPEMVTVPVPPPKNPPAASAPRQAPRENQIFSKITLTAPVFHDRLLHATVVPIPDEPLPALPVGASGGVGDVVGGMLNEASAPQLVPVAPQYAKSISIGGNVTASRLLKTMTLAYPELAKAARVFGEVIVKAVIDETGRVTGIRAVSGPVLLTPAAVDAVSREKFIPMLLNGRPIPCELNVQVSFQLSNPMAY